MKVCSDIIYPGELIRILSPATRFRTKLVSDGVHSSQGTVRCCAAFTKLASAALVQLFVPPTNSSSLHKPADGTSCAAGPEASPVKETNMKAEPTQPTWIRSKEDGGALTAVRQAPAMLTRSSKRPKVSDAIRPSWILACPLSAAA